MQTYVPVYRKLLWRAWKSTWQHKLLWFLGFFAGLATTGAITNDVLQLAPKMAPGNFSWQTLKESWDSFAFGQTYIATLMTGQFGQILITLAVSVCALLSLIFLILVAQHLVINHVHRAASNKKRLSVRAMIKEIEGVHVGRLFALNVLSRMALIIVLLVGALLMRNLLAVTAQNVQIFAALGVYTLILPAAFTINAVAITAIIHTIRKNDSLATSLQSATTFFAKHWLAAVEFSAILFLINFGASLLSLAGLYLTSLIVISLFTAAAGSLALLTLAAAISTMIIMFFIVVIGGMMTTYNYSAWTEFLQRFERLPAQARSEHVAHRLKRTVSR